MVSSERVGTLRYIGTVHFANGIWCGIELDEPVGKNNGEVKGVRYFTCPENCGVFITRHKISHVGGLLIFRSS